MTGIVIGIICLTAVLCVVAITMLKIEDKLVSISEQIYRLGKTGVSVPSKINDADAARMPYEVFKRYNERQLEEIRKQNNEGEKR